MKHCLYWWTYNRASCRHYAPHFPCTHSVMTVIGSLDAADSKKFLGMARSMASLELTAFKQVFTALGVSSDNIEALQEAAKKQDEPVLPKQAVIAKSTTEWVHGTVFDIARMLQGDPLEEDSPWNLPARCEELCNIYDCSGITQYCIPTCQDLLMGYMSCDVDRSILPTFPPDPNGRLPTITASLRRTERQLAVCRWLYGKDFTMQHYKSLRDHSKGFHDWIIERAKVVAIVNTLCSNIGFRQDVPDQLQPTILRKYKLQTSKKARETRYSSS